jgi:hypothetical protein
MTMKLLRALSLVLLLSVPYYLIYIDCGGEIVADHTEVKKLLAGAKRMRLVPHLPVALNLSGLYEELLAPLLPTQASEGEAIKDRVARM